MFHEIPTSCHSTAGATEPSPVFHVTRIDLPRRVDGRYILVPSRPTLLSQEGMAKGPDRTITVSGGKEER
jgi:hypothetical protein